jgi:hypothetical protein
MKRIYVHVRINFLGFGIEILSKNNGFQFVPFRFALWVLLPASHYSGQTAYYPSDGALNGKASFKALMMIDR